MILLVAISCALFFSASGKPSDGQNSNLQFEQSDGGDLQSLGSEMAHNYDIAAAAHVEYSCHVRAHGGLDCQKYCAGPEAHTKPVCVEAWNSFKHGQHMD